MNRHPATTRPTSLAILLIALTALGASDPEVVTVRIPASKLGAWFPAGTDLQILTPGEFNQLAGRARAAPEATRAPRVVKFRHSATWSAGLLSGRTELTLDPVAATTPGPIILDPWSPAIVGSPEILQSARATAEGRLVLKIDPARPRPPAIDWQLRAIPGTEGRGFALGLPDLDLSSLSLDLPAGAVPELDSGVRSGPEPGASPGRFAWRFDGAKGRLRLRVVDDAEGRMGEGLRLWLEGPTRIDLNASPANWRAEWTLDGAKGTPDRLAIDLDPGVELLDVSGPRVASFRVEPKGVGSRLLVSLLPTGAGQTSVSPLLLRGNCLAPSEGTWTVPTARPSDAIWTGGRVSIRVDPSRVLQGCAERSGRRVSARGSDPADASALIFEPSGAAGPVADLSFREPAADATVEVQGRLRLDRERPEIEVAMTWTIERGQLLTHAADLSPGWVPDRVATADGQLIPWHAEPLSHGGIRVHLAPSPVETERPTLTAILSASTRRSGLSGPIALPRVRPAPGSGKVSDEVWVAPRSEHLSVRPIQGRGLAWIDPPPASAGSIQATPWAEMKAQGGLAWRWLVDDADGGIECDPLKPDARVRTRLDAAIVAGRLRLDWTLAIDPEASGLRTLPIQIDPEWVGPLDWQPADPSGPGVVARPIDPSARASAGLAAAGSAWNLDMSKVPAGPFELKATVDVPWSGAGTIPMLAVPARFKPAGIVTLRVEESARCRVESTGLARIDRPEPASASPTAGIPPRADAGPRLRRAAMFEQAAASGRIFATTTTGLSGPNGGLVREASLVSQVFGGSGRRHRLTLAVLAGDSRSIELTLPPDHVLDRIRRDGEAIPAIPSGLAIRVDLLAPTLARPSTLLTLDYRSPEPAKADALRLGSILPACSLPCLSFIWEVATPGSWEVIDSSPGLVATEPLPAIPRSERLLGLAWGQFVGDGMPRPPSDREAMLLDLDALPGSIKDGETGLGDWFLRLDAGRLPIVIDRLALRSAGLGPASRSGSAISNAAAPNAVASVLQSLGLTAEPVGSSILITTPSQVPGRSTPTDRGSIPWLGVAHRVRVEGSDESDRYQSAGRWKGEATPRALALGESMGRADVAQGWHVRRFAAAGWPGPSTEVVIADRTAGAIRGWVLTLLILALALMARDFPSRVRAAAGSLVLGVAAILFSTTWPVPSELSQGLLRGFLAASACWIARIVATALLAAARRPTALRWGRARVSATGLIALGVAAGSAWGVGPERPILALLLDEGPPRPVGPPARVVMTVEDHERLRRLAGPRPAPAGDRALLASAEHRIDREGKDGAAVVSRYEVEVVGDGPATWSMPVGKALDLSARVDDIPTPLALAADAGSATLTLAGPGRHRVEFRRGVRLESVGDTCRRLRISINRAAFARVSVGREPGGPAVDLPGALGRVEAREGGVEGWLGPIDEIEGRWWAGDRDPSPSDPGDVDASILWDASPLGDSVRARLVHSGPEPLSSLRFEVDPGVLPRDFAIPGATIIPPSGTAGHPEWSVALDPPLPAGVPFEVGFWRSTVGVSPGRRTLPRFRVAGARRFSGILGFRRPSDWSGRLDLQEGLKPLEEAEFVRGWGALGGTGLTLAGTARFDASSEVSTTIGLPGRRRSVRTELRCDLGPGRLAATIDAVLSDREGRSFEAEVGLPTDFRITRLEAEGLVDWQRSSRDRVRLQFNGTEIRDRRIHLEGYVPAPSDLVLSESRSYQTRVPWPRWFGVEAEAGQLILSGPNRFTFDPAERDAPRLTLGPSAGTSYRAAFRVDRPEGLGPVVWTSPTALVGVSIRSDLVLGPEAAAWTAVVDCDISGGPAETLHWRIPTDWAEHATLEVDGAVSRPVVDSKGETTYWTITPTAPIWGHGRLVLRSSRPLVAGRAFAFPEIAPLSAPGRGTLDRYDLAIANLSGRALEVAGTAGLQAIDASQYRSEESSAPAGTIDRAYHVTGDRWSLQVRLGEPEGRSSASGEPAGARIESADLCTSVAPDGATWGCGHYTLRPRPGPFLELALPEAGSIAWASVDGLATIPIRDGSGRWSIPLGERAAKRVDLCWASPAPGGPAEIPRVVILPAPDQAGVPTTIRAFGSGATEFSGRSGSVVALDRSGWQLAIADGLAAKIAASMVDLDRGSRHDRSALVEDLARFELAGRSIERETPGRESLARLATLRTTVEDAAQDSGLDDAIEEARILVGLLPPSSSPATPGPADPADPLRIRHLGESREFRTTSPGRGRPIDLESSLGPARAGWSEVGFRAVAAGSLALAAFLAFGMLALRSRRAWPRA